MVYIPWKRQQNKWCSLFIYQAAEIDGSRTKMKITQEWSIPTDPLMLTQGHLFKERLIHRIQNCCWFCSFSLINGHVAMKKIQLESTNICSYIADEWGPRLYQNPTAKKLLSITLQAASLNCFKLLPYITMYVCFRVITLSWLQNIPERVFYLKARGSSIFYGLKWVFWWVCSEWSDPPHWHE